MPLLGRGLLPVVPVGHGGGEHGLPLPVGVVQGLVAADQLLLAAGFGVVAALLGGGGFGAGTEPGQPGLPGGGADLAELIADPLGRPGRFDRVGVAQVQQPAVGHAAHAGPGGPTHPCRSWPGAYRVADHLATGMAPTAIPAKIDIPSELVGDTGIEPVTSSV